MKINLCFCKVNISFERSGKPKVIETCQRNDSEFTFADSVKKSDRYQHEFKLEVITPQTTPSKIGSCEFLTDHRRSLVFIDNYEDKRSPRLNLLVGRRSKEKSQVDEKRNFLQVVDFSKPLIDRLSDYARKSNVSLNMVSAACKNSHSSLTADIFSAFKDKLISATSEIEISGITSMSRNA